MNRRLPAVALASAALLALLAACAPEPEVAPTASSTPTDATAPSSSPEPVETDQTHEPAPSEPTCETLLAPSTLSMFDEHGWTYREQEFRFGEDVVDDGFQCVWGDYSVASDHVQVFGWAQLDAAASAAAQQKLLSEGWLRADQDGRTYITEDPDFAFAVDEDGYGMTYEFGDGWATLADTRQGLLLIQLP
jgi:hypothetical protein